MFRYPMQKDLLSVIVPVYRTEAFAEKCVSSILNQSCSFLEVIVVNDGSDGPVREMAEEWMRRDGRVRYLEHEKNRGLLQARLTGVREARGEYIGFVDSDDYVTYDYFRNLVSAAKKTGADMAIGKTVREENGVRYVYNLHESMLSFGTADGDKMRRWFFEQELYCYSFHTIWNRVCRRSLWEKCLPAVSLARRHLVMGEDLLLTTLLVWNASRVCTVHTDAYIYCVRPAAATSAGEITGEGFCGRIRDLIYVFDFVGQYLQNEHAGKDILDHWEGGRAHFARMWGHLLRERGRTMDARRNARHLLQQLSGKKRTDDLQGDFFFEQFQTPWDGGLEYLKEEIGRGPETCISFDIFDTLITRPFYEPQDLFRMMEDLFEQQTHCRAPFHRLRMLAEEGAREKQNTLREDITLQEIYRYLSEQYAVSEETARSLCREEIRLEKRLCRARETGKELFETALQAGKQVILVSDMYLGSDVLGQILHHCGYAGYTGLFVSGEAGKRKAGGELFAEALKRTGRKPQEVLHIGDSWGSDMLGAKEAGIRCLFLPAAREVYENRIQGYATGRLSTLGQEALGTFPASGAAVAHPGWRMLTGLVCRKYFDNPYRTFLPGSDMNADPVLIGYGFLGMHLIGVCGWIAECMHVQNRKRVVFLGRDGWLLRRAFDLMEGGRFASDYLYASRKKLLPAMALLPADFFTLPVEYRAHSPRTMLELLSFAIPEEERAMAAETAAEEFPKLSVPFACRKEYEAFICLFLKKFYSPREHRKALKYLEEEFSGIEDGDLLFDLGYSGRIPRAILQVCGKKADVLYLHEDYEHSGFNSMAGGFVINSFYAVPPRISSIFREYLMSEPEKVPLESVPGRLVRRMLQESALEMVGDAVREYPKSRGWRSRSDGVLLSLGLEGFLQKGSAVDQKIFAEAVSDDPVFGGSERVQLLPWLLSEGRGAPLPERQETLPAFREDPGEDMEGERLRIDLNRYPLPVRALLMLLFDRQRFRYKWRKRWKMTPRK